MIVSSLMVISGVAVLSNVDWQTLRIGRGELETIIASTMFTGQILWLQRTKFAANNVNHFTLVMFLVTALVCLPVALATAPGPGPLHLRQAFLTGPMLVLTILAVSARSAVTC